MPKKKRQKNPFKVAEIVSQKQYQIFRELIRASINEYKNEEDESLASSIARRLMCALTNSNFVPKSFIAKKELVRCRYIWYECCPRTCPHRYWHPRTKRCDLECKFIHARVTKYKCVSGTSEAWNRNYGIIQEKKDGTAKD